MTIFLGLLLLITVGLLLYSPAGALLFVTLLSLNDYLQLVNFDVLYHLPIVKGISLNLGDFLAFFYFLYFLAMNKKANISSTLVGLVVFLIVSVVFAFSMSAVFASVDIRVVGNSLREFVVYFSLLGMVILVNKNDKFDLFIKLVYCFALIGIALHLYEALRGSPIVISGGGVTHSLYLKGAGTVGEVRRIWNRAIGPTIFVLAFSLASLLSTRKRVFFHLFVVGAALISILLAYTRSLYIITFIIVCFFLYSAIFKTKKGKGAIVFVALLFVITIGGMAVEGGKYYSAFTTRASTIASGGQEAGGKNTVVDRVMQIHLFSDILNESDLGLLTGVGFQTRTAEIHTADLGLINMYFKIGLLGIVFMIWYFVYMFKGLQFLKQSDDPEIRRIEVAMRCLLPAMVISSATFDYFLGSYFVVLVICTILLERGKHAVLRESAREAAGDVNGTLGV